MESKTIDQILGVISGSVYRIRERQPVDESYQKAVRAIADEYGVTYQTIGDGCRRRLRLRSVEEFKEMLKEAADGSPFRLKNLIMKHAPQSYAKKVEEAFNRLQAPQIAPSESRRGSAGEKTAVTLHFDETELSLIHALATLEGSKAEILVEKLCIKAVKQRLQDLLARM